MASTRPITDAGVGSASVLDLQRAAGNRATARVLRDHLSPPPTVQRAIGLEKETTVELTNIGFGTTIAGDPGRWHIDTDRKPDDNKPIIEIVIEHFDEHAGAEQDARAELTRRIDDAWAWVDGVRGLDPNESLRDGGIPNLTSEVGELTRRGAKTALNGVVHITVGVGMSSVPALYERLRTTDAGGGTGAYTKQRLADSQNAGPALAGLLQDVPGDVKAQTTGYLTYLANTVMTANDGWQVFGADENVYKSLPLVKNMFSALGRVPLRTIFDSLDERTREAVGSLSVDAVVGVLGEHHSAQGLGEKINMSLAEQVRARAEKTGGLRLDFMGADKRVRDLIASGLGKEKPIKTSDIVGKSTDVPVTDKRDGQEDVAAIELRKISGGMASDFQEATKDGIVDRGQQIISWSRANWPAPG